MGKEGGHGEEQGGLDTWRSRLSPEESTQRSEGVWPRGMGGWHRGVGGGCPPKMKQQRPGRCVGREQLGETVKDEPENF